MIKFFHQTIKFSEFPKLVIPKFIRTLTQKTSYKKKNKKKISIDESRLTAKDKKERNSLELTFSQFIRQIDKILSDVI